MSNLKVNGLLFLLAAGCASTAASGDSAPCDAPGGGAPDGEAQDAAAQDSAMTEADEEDAAARLDAGHDAAPRTCPIPAGRLVATGDSLTSGASYDDTPYPGLLAAKIGRPVENLGLGGTVAMNPNTTNVDLPSLADLTGTPGTALLRIGINDIRSLARSSDLVIKDIDAYIARQIAHGWRIIVQPIWRADIFVTADVARMRVNAHLAARYGALTIDDDTIMGDKADPADKTCFLDGIHPTPKCQAHQAEFALRALQRCRD